MIQKLFNHVGSTAAILNRLAAVAVLGMMLLTTMDVVLRYFRRPIPGTYEMVGFLGAVMISFSLAATSLSGGHIAVDFLVRKLPARVAAFIERANQVVCIVLFIMITRYLMIHAEGIRRSGETSMTLQLPISPFIYGIAAGCAVLCAVLIMQLVYSFYSSPDKKMSAE